MIRMIIEAELTRKDYELLGTVYDVSKLILGFYMVEGQEEDIVVLKLSKDDYYDIFNTMRVYLLEHNDDEVMRLFIHLRRTYKEYNLL